jgi:small subunit ribosomal protein S5
MAETTVDEGQALESTTVGIFRTATVVQGGRRFSFAALVVVGDRNGNVGLGYGKGRGVPVAIEKAQKEARKNLFRVPMNGSTLPHPIEGRFGSSRVRMLPAAPGTGVVAGGTTRAVLEMAGVGDVMTKAYGSSNQKNLCKAVVQGLQSLRTREYVASQRHVSIESTAVDEMLEASQRSLEEQESETASSRSERQQQAAARSGGGGVGSGGKKSKQKEGQAKGQEQASGEASQQAQAEQSQSAEGSGESAEAGESAQAQAQAGEGESQQQGEGGHQETNQR